VSTTTTIDWEDEDARAQCEWEGQPAWSRRAVFGAAGGLALAASGLLIPEWFVEEAAADQHPVRGVQHRADKRRQRRRHQLMQRRQRRRKQGGSKGNPGAFIKGIKLNLVNEYQSNSVSGRYYSGTVGWDRGRGFNIPLHGSETFETGKLHAGLLFRVIGDGPFVWAENPLTSIPDVNVEVNGELTPNDYINGKFALAHEALKEGQETSVVVPEWTGAPQNIKITFRREDDTDDFKVFTITITKG
jgi:hypothetical protein